MVNDEKGEYPDKENQRGAAGVASGNAAAGVGAGVNVAGTQNLEWVHCGEEGVGIKTLDMLETKDLNLSIEAKSNKQEACTRKVCRGSVAQTELNVLWTWKWEKKFTWCGTRASVCSIQIRSGTRRARAERCAVGPRRSDGCEEVAHTDLDARYPD
ncbi:hypothetical protein B0H17DRAFT_1149824 [Mycena rosella]|uniref:Uncharacterized protein n=1 Tax=Mycena rosella TaxID=1033263 RepID=A0AAD7BY35_MYCRO|nr:hypothetical protein B0H17DRAFT_1149824 [Mycena rosella]